MNPFQPGAARENKQEREIIMLTFALFSIGLALGLSCARVTGRGSANDSDGTTHSVGLNGILVADR